MEEYLLLVVSFAVLFINVYIVTDIFRKQAEIIFKPLVTTEALAAIKRLISLCLLVGGISGAHILVLMKGNPASPIDGSQSFDVTNWLDTLFKAIFYAYQGLAWPVVITFLGLLIASAILKTKQQS